MRDPIKTHRRRDEVGKALPQTGRDFLHGANLDLERSRSAPGDADPGFINHWKHEVIFLFNKKIIGLT